MAKFDDLRSRPGFDYEWEAVARATMAAVGRAKASPENPQGSIDVEISLAALMTVAAGIIAKDVNLKTRRDVRLQAEEFGRMLRDMALSDRDAGEAGEPQFLDLFAGAGLSPGKNTKAVN